MSRTGTTRTGVRRLLLSGATTSALGLPVTLLVTPFVIHEVGVFTYGTYAVLGAWLAVGALLDFGLRAEMTRRIAQANGRDDVAAIVRTVREGTSLLICGAALIVLLATSLGHLLVRFAFPEETQGAVAQPYLLTVGVFALLAFNFATDGFLTVLDGLQRSDVRQYTSLATTLVTVAATLVFVNISPSAWSLLSAGALSSIFGATLGFIAVRRIAPYVKIRWSRPTRSAANSYLRVSLLLVLTQVSDVVDFNLDRVYISRYAGSAVAGQYSIGAQLPLTLRGYSLIPLGFLIAATAELRERNPARLEKLYTSVTKLSLGAYAIVLAGIISLAPIFYDSWLGEGFGQAATTSKLLCLAMALNVLGAPWSLRAVGSGWYRAVGAAAGSNLATNAVASLLLTQAMGLQGALYGSIIGNACGLVVLYICIRMKERRPWLRPALGPVAVCLLGVVGGHLAVAEFQPRGWGGLLGTGALLALGMLGCLMLTRTVRPREVAYLLRRRPPAGPSVPVQGGNADQGSEEVAPMTVELPTEPAPKDNRLL